MNWPAILRGFTVYNLKAFLNTAQTRGTMDWIEGFTVLQHGKFR